MGGGGVEANVDYIYLVFDNSLIAANLTVYMNSKKDWDD